MRRTAFLLILVSLATLSCQRSESTVAVAPSPGAGARQPPEAYPTKDEVLDYLDGKTISLSAPAAPAKGEAQFVLKRDKIEAL